MPTQAVVAVGCMAERYGNELADSLPEADAVLGFDDYPDIAGRLRSILAGEQHVAACPARPAGAAADHAGRPRAASARRRSPDTRIAEPDLPLRPRPRQRTAGDAPPPRRRARWRRSSSPRAATVAARSARSRASAAPSSPAARPRCSTRRAGWPTQGVRELFLVSENSTSYGKDLGDLRLLETLLPELAAVDGRRPGAGLLPAAGRDPAGPDRGDRRRRRVSARTSTSRSSTRRARCCGGCAGSATPSGSSSCSSEIRRQSPLAGARSNFIVGFPGETEDDVEILCDFLTAARLDAVGIFGYSDEDGTEAVGLDGHHDADEIRARVEHVSRLAEELTAQRAEDRIGERVEVLVESLDGDDRRGPRRVPGAGGRRFDHGRRGASGGRRVGDIVRGRVTEQLGCRPRRGRAEAIGCRLCSRESAQPSNWNLPNALTTLRILLVPLFGWLLLRDGRRRT